MPRPLRLHPRQCSTFLTTTRVSDGRASERVDGQEGGVIQCVEPLLITPFVTLHFP